MGTHAENFTPLAIIGMACRLPGADGLEQFWQLLKTGHSAIDQMPASRMNRELYLAPERGVLGKSYTSIAGLVSQQPVPEDIPRLTANEIEDADVSHLELCRVMAQACRHANVDPQDLPYRRAGVYVAHSKGSTVSSQLAYGDLIDQLADWLRSTPEFADLTQGKSDQTIANIVASASHGLARRNGRGGPNIDAHQSARLLSKAFALDGPSLALNAACASSLMALAFGATALRLGTVDMAVVGSASFCKSDTLVLFSNAQSVSATGSRPFDTAADGLVAAEGYVVLLLRTLDRAVADGNPIHAVIRGVGVSSDGRGKSLWAPRAEGQLEALKRAYTDVDPATLQYIEAHATSTQAGDATEVNALAKFLGQHLPAGTKIPVGSVKSNIGHTFETAGLAGLVKSVLAIQHRLIPPTINVRQPNPKIDWQACPLFVADRAIPWPDPLNNQPRRAAVNAFGIGGLNAHVVLEQYQGIVPPGNLRPYDFAGSETPVSDAPIAVLGISILAPGALTIEDFWNLLRGQGVAVRPFSESSRVSRDDRQSAGFLDGYAYDWRRHKIPPKQIAHADPLQFMLLDAVDRALIDAGCQDASFDRQRTGVIVGNRSGSEFVKHLSVSLRLPEFSRSIREVLHETGATQQQVDAVCRRFSETFYERLPHLKDETGSFTNSTLASRITKTFDLMGPAAAVDAGDASALAALEICINVLRSGQADTMLCAAGERSLGTGTFETLRAAGRLSRSGRPKPLSVDADGVVPAEAAGVLVLKRLDDAKRDGDRIRAVIRAVGVASGSCRETVLVNSIRRGLAQADVDPSHMSAVELAAAGMPNDDQAEIRALAQVFGKSRPSPLALGTVTSRIGHSFGAAGMIAAIKATLAVQAGQLPGDASDTNLIKEVTTLPDTFELFADSKQLRAVDSGGRLLVGVNAACDDTLAYHVVMQQQIAHRKCVVSAPRQESEEAAKSTTRDNLRTWRIARFEADTPAALAQVVDQAIASHADVFAEDTRAEKPFAQQSYRVAIVADSSDDLAAKARRFVKHHEHPDAFDILARQGIYFAPRPAHPPRLAMIFPGQGSQYPGMLSDLCANHPVAARAVADFNKVLDSLQYPTYEDLVLKNPGDLGRDVWRTQLSLLLADAILFQVITAMGLRPDRITGHSFGEFPALWAAGAWTFADAALATFWRCHAITACDQTDGIMLSCSANEKLVAPLCQETDGEVFVANCNSPKQTVVGGRQDAVERLAAILTARGVTTTVLPVPRPFHTPLMTQVMSPLRSSLADVPINPPCIPLLSSVTNRYVAEPSEIRQNLVTQMTQPVRFVDQIQRLAAEGVDLFVEVGPSDVLSRITRQNLEGSPPYALACDVRKQNGREQLTRLQAALEVLGAMPDHDHTHRVVRQELVRLDPDRRIERTVTASHDLRAQTGRDCASTPDEELPILRLQGTPYQMGFAHGQAMREPIRRVLRHYCDICDTPADRLPQIENALQNLERLVTAREREEIRGVADGAGVAIPNLMAMNLRIYPELAAGGCTHFLVKSRTTASQPYIQGANEDQPFGLCLQESVQRTVQIRRPTDGHAYVTFAMAGQVGGINGVNDRGLSVTSAMLLDRARPSGRPRGLLHVPIVSRLLREASDLKDAVTILEQSNGDGAWGLCLGHAPSGKMCYAEYDGDHLRVQHDEATYLATNHALLAKATVDVPSHSLHRLARLQSLVTSASDQVTPKEAQRWLRDRFDVARDKEVRHPTMNTLRRVDNQISVVIQPQLATLWVTRGNRPGQLADEYVRLDLQELMGLAPVNPQQATVRAKSTVEKGRSDICSRFVPRLIAIPSISHSTGQQPFSGRCIILGDNPHGRALAAKLRQLGADAALLPGDEDGSVVIERFQQAAAAGPIQHLFVMTSFDQDAVNAADATGWSQCRAAGVLTPYFLCQHWFGQLSQAQLLNQASLTVGCRLGGDFGIESLPQAAEGGAMLGLARGLWREVTYPQGNDHGFRSKVVDTAPNATPDQVATWIVAEHAMHDGQLQVGYRDGQRYLVRPVHDPLDVPTVPDDALAGVWVVSGGARGVTAAVARAMGRIPGIRLHLIGHSPPPQVPQAWRDLTAEETKQLRARVMRDAVAAGRVPIDTWQQAEKAIEIDQNLRRLTQAGIDATYHACDVGDRAALANVLETVRRTDGPIHGIIHGAGFERAASFAKKKPDLVQRTMAAKLDGATALFELTNNDPLAYFVAFGSISGRFGGVGQTDYCAANAMLATLVTAYRHRRPEVRAVTIDWHSWDEVGMAVRPESKHIKELGKIRFMPVDEGVRHLLDEIRSDASNSEVVITDWQYYRSLFPNGDGPATTSTVLPNRRRDTATRQLESKSPQEDQGQVARRHVLRMSESPLEHAARSDTTFYGPAIVLGDNPDAAALVARLKSLGVPVHGVPCESPDSVVTLIRQILTDRFSPHLYLMTGRDPRAGHLRDWRSWQWRRATGVLAPFRACQAWIERYLHEVTPPATLLAGIALGGDFGFQTSPGAAEGGMLTGMIKSIGQEARQRGWDALRVRAVDFSTDVSPTALAEAMIRETFAAGSVEVAYQGNARLEPVLVAEPAIAGNSISLPRGTWIAVGGARGITARAGLELTRRFGLKMHLIGSSPMPEIPAAWRSLTADSRKTLKRDVVSQALADGQLPGKQWEPIEKALEVDATLRAYAQAGLGVEYHVCDVKHWDQLSHILDQIRRSDGPIRGIVQGAGTNRPERFERQSLAEIEGKVRVKVDATMALIHLTRSDPLEHFIGFGSLAGRFGTLCQADYAATSDMLCKLMGYLRAERPEVRAVGIHWPPWGEVGMMTRSVGFAGREIRRLATMPPQVGVQHLIDELLAGVCESEIVLADDDYLRESYAGRQRHNERSRRRRVPATEMPLLESITRQDELEVQAEVHLDPQRDVFLAEHLLRDRPLLPIVVAMEAFAEAAALLATDQERVAGLQQVEAVEGLRFLRDEPWTVRVTARREGSHVACELRADFHNTRGKLVVADRLYFRGRVVLDAAPASHKTVAVPERSDWVPVTYPPKQSFIYHGTAYRCLQRFSYQSELSCAELREPATGLFGHRTGRARLPAVPMDGCLFASGIHFWLGSKGQMSIPQQVKQLCLYRLPNPGERMFVLVKPTPRDTRFEVTLCGDSGSVLLELSLARVVSLGGSHQ